MRELKLDYSEVTIHADGSVFVQSPADEKKYVSFSKEDMHALLADYELEHGGAPGLFWDGDRLTTCDRGAGTDTFVREDGKWKREPPTTATVPDHRQAVEDILREHLTEAIAKSLPDARLAVLDELEAELNEWRASNLEFRERNLRGEDEGGDGSLASALMADERRVAIDKVLRMVVKLRRGDTL